MQCKNLFSLLAFTCLSAMMQAQSPDYRPNLIPPSPDATALARHGESRIGLNAGTIPITVPLHTIIEGAIEVPINLTYHGGGNRVDEAASFAGLGFTLNAGGAIMRSVRGLPDDYPTKGFIDYTTTYSLDYLKNDRNRYTQWQELAEGCADAEPDAYYFNFSGYTGSFSLRDYSNGVYILTKNAWNVQMLKTDVNNPKRITGWKFTCDDGVVYTFTAAEQATIMDNGAACQANMIYNSAWYLTNITSPNGGRSVNFTYETYSMNFNVMQAETQRIFCYANPGGCLTTPAASTQVLTKMTYAGQRVKTITTSDNGTTITFNYLTTRTDEPGTNLKQLDEIIINNKDNTLFRKYNLTYDYSSGRLSLKSVKKTGTNEPPYIFDYSLTPLPPRITNGGTAASFGQDHWGFASLKNTNNTLLPPVWKKDPSAGGGMIYYPGADRRGGAANAGMLTKVTNPSGGFEEYIYESNMYGFVGQQSLGDLGYFATSKVSKTAPASATATSAIPEEVVISEQHITVKGANDNNMVDVTLEISGSKVLVTGATAVVQVCKDDGGDPGASLFFEKKFTTYQATPTKTKVYLKLPGGGNYLVRAIAGGIKPPAAGHTGPTLYSVASITAKWTDEQPTSTPLKYKYGGGLRIRSIRSSAYLNDPNVITREFIYNDDETGFSSGMLAEEPKFDIQNLKYYNTSEAACAYDLRMSLNLSLLGYGPSVLYKQVSEFSGIDASNGKTIYLFNPKFAAYNSNAQPPFQLTTFSYTYPGLEGEKLLKKTDNNYQLVRETSSLNSYYSRYEYDVLKVSFDGGSVTPAKFHSGLYRVEHGFWNAISSLKRDYSSSGTSYTETLVNREFDNFGRLLRERKIYDNNESSYDQTEYLRPEFFNNPTPAIQKLIEKNITGSPLEVVEKKVKNGVESYTGATLNFSALDASSRVFPSTTQKLQLTQPSSTYTYAAYSAAGVVDSRFVTINTIEKFDAKENLIQYTPKNGVTISYLWDKHNMEPIVRAEGVAADKIAYSGFENTNPIAFGGVWTLPGTYVTTDYYTGKRAYQGTLSINTAGFLSQSYILSFWIKATQFKVNGATIAGTGTWTLYETNVAGGSTITIETLTGIIDEVRVYPPQSKMTTSGYDHLLGKTCQTDEKSRPTFYEMDNLGRLYVERNHNRDIVRRYNYEYDVLNPINYTITVTQTADYTYQFTVNGGNAGNTYEWDFGDLTTANTSTATTTHAYPSLTLKFPVNVRVKSSTNTIGTPSTEIVSGKVGGNGNICIESDFNISQLAAARSYNFQAPNISGATYFWSPGDGSVKFGSNCDQTYATPGDYRVDLTITVAGKSCSTSKNITVK